MLEILFQLASILVFISVLTRHVDFKTDIVAKIKIFNFDQTLQVKVTLFLILYALGPLTWFDTQQRQPLNAKALSRMSD